MRIGNLRDWFDIGAGVQFRLNGAESRTVRCDIALAEPAAIQIVYGDAVAMEVGLPAGLTGVEFTIEKDCVVQCDDPDARIRTFDADAPGEMRDNPPFTRLHQRKPTEAWEIMMRAAQKNADDRAAALEREIAALRGLVQKGTN